MRAIERTMRSLRLARAAAAGLVAAVLLTSPGAGWASPLLYFVHTDHLNTPRLIADQNQTTVWRWDQVEPFGANPPDEDPDGNSVIFHMPFRFPGQHFDKETGLAYNMARDYASDTGRYIQSDPIGLAGGINTYGYALSNPLTYIDPLGEFVIVLPAIPAVGGAVVQAIVGGLAAGAILSVPGDTKQEAKGAKAAEGPATGKGRTYCQVRCNVYPIGECKTCPDIVFGNGYGRSGNEAWNNALASANAGVPQGCGYRHCHGVGGSCKGRTGGKAR